MPRKTQGMPGYYESTELREISIKVSILGIVLFALGIGLMMFDPVSTMTMFPEKSGGFSVSFVTGTGLAVLGMLASFSGLLTISADRFVGGLFLKRKKSGGGTGPY